MIAMPTVDSQETRRLREAHYNATLVDVLEIHDSLRILRVLPDEGIPEFRAGQFVSLGLGYWEPRVAGAQVEQLDRRQLQKAARRAYSISCTMLDADNKVVAPGDWPYLEFFVALVRHGGRRPPAMSPRLFALQRGDRLFAENRAAGTFTLNAVSRDDDVVMLATGTGEAPHNAMVAELLASDHQGKIASVSCVRHRRDLAYLETHRRLERLFGNYRYRMLTTREPENVDPGHPDFQSKQYLQDYVASGRLQRETGLALRPERTHAFVCGNPAMIGAPVKQPGSLVRQPVPGGMIDVLTRLGFHPDEPHQAGNVHFERYW